MEELLSDFLFNKKRSGWWWGLVIGLLFLLFLTISFVVFLQPADSSNPEKVVFILKKGDSFQDIASQLERQGLIKSKDWFKMYSLVTGSAHLFKPGVYELSSAMNGRDIITAIVFGPPDVKLTIKEGATLADIDKQLSEAKILKAGELLKFNENQKRSLEGFLFPDTYHFAQYSSVDEVVDKLLGNFKNKLGNYIRENDYSHLIIASLIEKEAIHPQDRLLISGILEKRLKIGMALQIDASIVYAKCDGAFLTCDEKTRNLSSKDLKMRSPYNTYLHPGLPPTPISNPGRDAVVAAMNPQKSKYLYYISNPKTGRMVFAQTLDEHNQNRFKYLR